MNDFPENVSSKITGISLDYDEMDMHFLKLYVLYADDTLPFSETAKDMQKIIIATLSYCEVNNMSVNTSKPVNYLLARQIRKDHAITAHSQAIERVDTFCYEGFFR